MGNSRGKTKSIIYRLRLIASAGPKTVDFIQ